MSDELPILSEALIRAWIADDVPVDDFAGKRVLLIVPDATRSAPLSAVVRCTLLHICGRWWKHFDVMVALGTHPPMSEDAICKLLGIAEQEQHRLFLQTHLFNHEWDNPDALTTIGTLSAHDTEEMSNGLLSIDVPVQINSRVNEYDMLLVLGPVFPHEVVGFSGGNKYYFPGISGPDLLNFFHWLGALDHERRHHRREGYARSPGGRSGGVAHSAGAEGASRSSCRPKADRDCTACSTALPKRPGTVRPTCRGRCTSSASRKPFQTVLSCAPPMYDELWVAGKCMYKLEPVVADGGELIIYAPHMNEISVTHGRLIEEVGYHCRDYFTRQWDRFKHYPWGVLAHSTHVRGGGTFENGVENCRVQVTLASGIPEEVCRRINLGYRDPQSIDVESFADREDEGVLLVRKAGEQLYRLEHEEAG